MVMRKLSSSDFARGRRCHRCQPACCLEAAELIDLHSPHLQASAASVAAVALAVPAEDSLAVQAADNPAVQAGADNLAVQAEADNPAVQAEADNLAVPVVGSRASVLEAAPVELLVKKVDLLVSKETDNRQCQAGSCSAA